MERSMNRLAPLALVASVIALPAAAQTSIAGQWIVTVDRFGTPEYSTLNLIRDGDAVRGDWDGDVVTGRARGRSIDLTIRDRRGAIYRFTGTMQAGQLRGAADYPDNNHPERRL